MKALGKSLIKVLLPLLLIIKVLSEKQYFPHRRGHSLHRKEHFLLIIEHYQHDIAFSTERAEVGGRGAICSHF